MQKIEFFGFFDFGFFDFGLFWFVLKTKKQYKLVCPGVSHLMFGDLGFE